MSKRMIAVMAAIVCMMTVGASAAQATPHYSQPLMYETLRRGYCPVELLCPNIDNPAHPIMSRPGHLVRIVAESGPPYRVVRPGETLWGIAERFLHNGRDWTELCTEHKHNPRDLQIGESVFFC